MPQDLDKFEKLAALPSVAEALADKYSRWDAGEEGERGGAGEGEVGGWVLKEAESGGG